MRASRVVVIGAGIGGLVAALDLAARGVAVTVIERAETPGGKMREVVVDGARVDAGPTVFTMRWVFDELFAACGTTLDAHIALRPAETLARHFWAAGGRLDLFADVARSAAAIGAFAGATEARGYQAFCARARRVYRGMEGPFIRAARPTPMSLAGAAGLGGLAQLRDASPFQTLWRALGEHFQDPRLRQLFGRYATYCGSSPFQAAATLMLVAHVEQDGVWLVQGGMHRLAVALADLAAARGAKLRYGTEARAIGPASGRVAWVELADGERLAADAVVVNADPAAVAGGLFGGKLAGAVAATLPAARSLSAVTWAMRATSRFPLARHTVFFSDRYQAEFDDIFQHGRLPVAPTVYVCAQDRDDAGNGAGASERLLCLVNAPARADTRALTPTEIETCQAATFLHLDRCGLSLDPTMHTIRTTPADFHHLFPATGGALYGPASHGWRASFTRPTARTRLRGLYLAGGGTHPGPGVPMAALSGRMAAASVLADLPSTARFRAAAMSGGMSTR